MKVILLAAGFGTRLKPITDTIPKCLVPVKGKPILQIWLEKLTHSGFKSFLINTHYLSNKVDLFINNCPQKDLCIIKYEKKLLGTAGTLLSNLDFIEDEECLLIHADNYCNADISELIKAHNQRPDNCLITMMIFRTNNPSSCGIVQIDKNNIVYEFHEKSINPPGNLANAAIYVLSSQFIEILKLQFHNVSDFSTEVLPHFIKKIYTYETKELFVDIGTLESYNFANNS